MTADTRSIPQRVPRMDFHAVLIMPEGGARESLAVALWDVGMLVTVFGSVPQAEGVLVSEPVDVVLVDGTELPGACAGLGNQLRAVGKSACRVVELVGPDHAGTRGGAADQAVRVRRPEHAAVFARQLAAFLGLQRGAWR